METKKKYEIYNKKYNEYAFFESYDYCAGTFLAWNLIMKGWKIKDCIVKELKKDEADKNKENESDERRTV